MPFAASSSAWPWRVTGRPAGSTMATEPHIIASTPFAPHTTLRIECHGQTTAGPRRVSLLDCDQCGARIATVDIADDPRSEYRRLVRAFVAHRRAVHFVRAYASRRPGGRPR